MSLHRAIRAALETRLAATPGLPLARAWESLAFDPPAANVPYVRATYQPTGSRAVTSGETPVYLHTGLFLVDLFYPGGVGAGACEAMADTVRGRFPPTLSLLAAGDWVGLRYADRGPGLPADGRFLIPVTLAWRCHSRNV